MVASVHFLNDFLDFNEPTMNFKTADLCDQFADRVQVAEPLLRDYGGKQAFCGPISTVKAVADNSFVRSALEEPGNGRVLVVDGGGHVRCALLGDMLAALGLRNGWAGAIIYGCIRDSEEIAAINIGVKALATHPMKSAKRNEGQRDVAVRFGGVSFVPGQWVYADPDGIVVAEKPLD